MAKTAVADIIIPTEFEKYAIERTAELSRFWESGIVEMAPEFDELAAGGGREVKMPFWKDLTATRQILSDSGSLAVNKISSDQDIARIHNDAQVWSVNHLAKVIAGDDPMQAIVDLVGGYWARTDEGLIISSLKGMFGAASMAGNLLAIHSESIAGQSSSTRLNGATFVDATAKLGDAADRLTATQSARLLGFKPEEIPMLVAAGLLKPLGHPPRNSTKYFATETLEQLRRDEKWLARASDAICAYWRQSNARKAAHGRGPAGSVKGSSGTAA